MNDPPFSEQVFVNVPHEPWSKNLKINGPVWLFVFYKVNRTRNGWLLCVKEKSEGYNPLAEYKIIVFVCFFGGFFCFFFDTKKNCGKFEGIVSSNLSLSLSVSVCLSLCLCLSVCLSLSLSHTHTHLKQKKWIKDKKKRFSWTDEHVEFNYHFNLTGMIAVKTILNYGN